MKMPWKHKDGPSKTKNKGKEPAERRIAQLKSDIKTELYNQVQISENFYGEGRRKRMEGALRKIEKMFNSAKKEVAGLVENHALEHTLLSDFTRQVENLLYEEAGRQKCFRWQAAFSKKIKDGSTKP